MHEKVSKGKVEQIYNHEARGFKPAIPATGASKQKSCCEFGSSLDCIVVAVSPAAVY